MTINNKKETTYDAIVIGSGISGGYAAMELCTKGYKTLVLERGRMVKHGDYPTANMDRSTKFNKRISNIKEAVKTSISIFFKLILTVRIFY